MSLEYFAEQFSIEHRPTPIEDTSQTCTHEMSAQRQPSQQRCSPRPFQKEGYSCPKCGKKFNLQSQLRKHVIGKHTPYEMRPYSCDTCSTRTMSLKDLRRHEKTKSHRKLEAPAPQYEDAAAALNSDRAIIVDVPACRQTLAAAKITAQINQAADGADGLHRTDSESPVTKKSTRKESEDVAAGDGQYLLPGSQRLSSKTVANASAHSNKQASPPERYGGTTSQKDFQCGRKRKRIEGKEYVTIRLAHSGSRFVSLDLEVPSTLSGFRHSKRRRHVTRSTVACWRCRTVKEMVKLYNFVNDNAELTERSAHTIVHPRHAIDVSLCDGALIQQRYVFDID